MGFQERISDLRPAQVSGLAVERYFKRIPPSPACPLVNVVKPNRTRKQETVPKQNETFPTELGVSSQDRRLGGSAWWTLWLSPRHRPARGPPAPAGPKPSTSLCQRLLSLQQGCVPAHQASRITLHHTPHTQAFALLLGIRSCLRGPSTKHCPGPASPASSTGRGCACPGHCRNTAHGYAGSLFSRQGECSQMRWSQRQDTDFKYLQLY